MGKPLKDGGPQSASEVRDRLAIERTALANERTLLAYVRTGLALAVVGASSIKFLASLAADVLGAFFLVAGVATVAMGVRRFAAMRKRLAALAPCGDG